MRRHSGLVEKTVGQKDRWSKKPLVKKTVGQKDRWSKRPLVKRQLVEKTVGRKDNWSKRGQVQEAKIWLNILSNSQSVPSEPENSSPAVVDELSTILANRRFPLIVNID